MCASSSQAGEQRGGRAGGYGKGGRIRWWVLRDGDGDPPRQEQAFDGCGDTHEGQGTGSAGVAFAASAQIDVFNTFRVRKYPDSEPFRPYSRLMPPCPKSLTGNRREHQHEAHELALPAEARPSSERSSNDRRQGGDPEGRLHRPCSPRAAQLQVPQGATLTASFCRALAAEPRALHIGCRFRCLFSVHDCRGSSNGDILLCRRVIVLQDLKDVIPLTTPMLSLSKGLEVRDCTARKGH